MRFKSILKFVLSGILILSLVGCGSIFDKEAMGKVKRVAVVGFTMDYHMSISGSIGSTLLGGEKKMGMSKVQNRLKETRISKAAYEHLVKKFKKVGWQVASSSKVANSTTIKNYYNKKVKVGFLPLQSHHERQRKQGIPQYHYIGGLRGKGMFSKMAKELGIDALIIAYAETNIGNSLGLIGSTKYSSKIMLDVLDPRTDKYIMRMRVDGDTVKEVDKLGNFDDVTQFNTYTGLTKATEKLVESLAAKIK